MKAGFVSLGCAKNLVDTEVMLGILTNKGFEITDQYEDAELIIINTCGFIDSAKKESIDTILEKVQYKATAKCKGIIVAGCLAQRYHGELLEEMPEVDAFLGTGAWHRIGEAADAVLAGKKGLFIDDMTTLYDEATPRLLTNPTFSAYVKVADGCSNCCSYCVIPSVRGQFRSRSIESIVAEVARLVKQGTKEINLIAQDTTSFGRDVHGQPRLTELLAQLVRIDGLKWIRLLYCYPKYFSNDVIDIMAKEEKICNYVDLPLQHINSDILKAMKRKDTREEIEALLARIRSQVPGVAIRTTFIVGFPGETQQHYEELRQFILEQRFDHVGIFTYSQEEGTLAGNMPDQVSEEVKQERYHELMAIQSQISQEINQSLRGKRLEVLVEEISDEDAAIIVGRSYREAPDVDGRVYVENAAGYNSGDFVVAKVDQGFAYDLVAIKV